VVVDHRSLFIYEDFGYPWSYHVMSLYCTNLNSIKIDINFLCMIIMSTLNICQGITIIWVRKCSSWRKLWGIKWVLMLIKMLSKPTTQCMLGKKCKWNGGLMVWKWNANDWWKYSIPQTQSTHTSLCKNENNMITNMITFVVINNIYDYHAYSAYIFVAKVINCIFGHSCKCHSHQIFNYYSHNSPYH